MNVGTRYLQQEEADECRGEIENILDSLERVLFGQRPLLEHCVCALMAGGHVLLEGLPGLGKTELVKGLAKALQLESRRIQFTPDLLPGDITGNPLLEEEDGRRSFRFHRGPLFANLVLADEINRASPKTQSALLEAMQEAHVTVLGETHELPRPFFVLATQNPIELEGTYPLPEAQLDRFLMKLEVRPNGPEVLEQIVMNRELGQSVEIEPVLEGPRLMEILKRVRRVYLPPVVARYIARLVSATHRGSSRVAEALKYGASPRAALGLSAAARSWALKEGRAHASFEDVEAVAVPVLQHRIILDYGARVSGTTTSDLVLRLLDEIGPADKRVPSTLEHEGVETRS